MKTTLFCLTILAFVGTAFAGQTTGNSPRTYKASEATCCNAHTRPCGRLKNAGTPGAFYRSNPGRNAVILVNDTPQFMTFFVYSGDLCAPNDINALISNGAHVYETVVPPYTRSYTNQRGRHYWIGSKPGKWGIDPAKNRIARL
jgi:hypothetical protein